MVREQFGENLERDICHYSRNTHIFRGRQVATAAAKNEDVCHLVRNDRGHRVKEVCDIFVTFKPVVGHLNLSLRSSSDAKDRNLLED